MLGWAKSSAAYVKGIFEKCLTVPDYNSRLIFLTNAAVIHAIALWQTFNYLHTAPADRDPSYPTIIGVLLAGHATSAFGRYLTKRTGEKPDAPGPDSPDKDTPAPGSSEPKG